MRIGVAVGELQPSLGSIADEARAAADGGLAGIWMAQRSGLDALTTAAVVGHRVPGIELGTAVVPTYPRHPLALAAQALTVQDATGGRLTLGLGVSHRQIVEGQFGLSFERPARHLREYLSALMPLLRGETVTIEGETLKAVGTVDIAGVAAPSVLVGALGPAMLKVAGELTDGTIAAWATASALSEYLVPTISRAAGTKTPRVVASTLVCVTSRPDDHKAAVAENFSVINQVPAYRAMLDRGAAAGPQDAVVFGDESSVERQLQRLLDAGATDFALMPFGDAEEQARTNALLAELSATD
jgi:F420-dependent oxidoreductase-like protein